MSAISASATGSPGSRCPGSYAAEVTGPADRLVPVPDGVTDQQAAAADAAGPDRALPGHDSYPVAEGDTVLVHAGAGGVGLLLTQIAKIRGARVITTVSTPEKAELSRAAGADDVLVGYDGFTDRVRELTDGVGVAAVYDGVGKDTFDGSLASIRRRGMMVLFGGSSGQVPPFDLQRLNRSGSLSVTRPTLVDFVVTRAELLGRCADLFGWVTDGRLRGADRRDLPAGRRRAGARGPRRPAHHRQAVTAALICRPDDDGSQAAW